MQIREGPPNTQFREGSSMRRERSQAGGSRGLRNTDLGEKHQAPPTVPPKPQGAGVQGPCNQTSVSPFFSAACLLLLQISCPCEWSGRRVLMSL